MTAHKQRYTLSCKLLYFWTKLRVGKYMHVWLSVVRLFLTCFYSRIKMKPYLQCSLYALLGVKINDLVWFYPRIKTKKRGFYSITSLNYACLCCQARRTLKNINIPKKIAYVLSLSVGQVTWLIAPENMSHTSALKLSGTPLSIRSWVLTVRYIQTPLQDAKTRTTS